MDTRFPQVVKQKVPSVEGNTEPAEGISKPLALSWMP